MQKSKRLKAFNRRDAEAQSFIFCFAAGEINFKSFSLRLRASAVKTF